MISAGPSIDVAMVATEERNASIITIPKPSNIDGRTNRSAEEKYSAAFCFTPRKAIVSFNPRLEESSSKAPRSLPSPMINTCNAGILSFTIPVARINVSTDFCFSRRPTNRMQSELTGIESFSRSSSLLSLIEIFGMALYSNMTLAGLACNTSRQCLATDSEIAMTLQSFATVRNKNE